MPNPNYVYQPLNPDYPLCLIPVEYDHYYYSVQEILQYAIPSIIFFTVWHIFFNYTIGNYFAKKAIYLEFGKYPPLKPVFVSTEQRLSPKKMLKLKNYFENEAKSKTTKRRTTDKRANTPTITIPSNYTNNKLENPALRNRFKRIKISKTPKHLLQTKILPPNQQSKENIAFLCNRKSDSNRRKLLSLANDLGYSIDEIRQYKKWMKVCTKGETLRRKFCEESWKFMTMFFVTIYGIHTILNQEYFYNPRILFTHAYDIPQQETYAVLIYYQIAIGYHVHRAFWQFFEQRRADFVAMFIHHSVTILLLLFSWRFGLMAIGAMVMICHDNADVLLPLAKCFRWLKYEMCTNVTYVLFTVVWILSRIVLFSWKILFPLVVYGYSAYYCQFVYYLMFTFGLFCLLCLHLYWTKFILPVFLKYCCVKGHEIQDVRSSDSDYDSDIEPHHLKSDSSDEGNIIINGKKNKDQNNK